jgi:hypothetical protein
MALTELSLHSAIRTYARQHGTGQRLRFLGTPKGSDPFPDQISLSHAARNIQQIRQVAAAVVMRRHAELSPLAQRSLIQTLEREARLRYADQLEGELLPAEVVHAWFLSWDANGFGGETG